MLGLRIILLCFLEESTNFTHHDLPFSLTLSFSHNFSLFLNLQLVQIWASLLPHAEKGVPLPDHILPILSPILLTHSLTHILPRKHMHIFFLSHLHSLLYLNSSFLFHRHILSLYLPITYTHTLPVTRERFARTQ